MNLRFKRSLKNQRRLKNPLVQATLIRCFLTLETLAWFTKTGTANMPLRFLFWGNLFADKNKTCSNWSYCCRDFDKITEAAWRCARLYSYAAWGSIPHTSKPPPQRQSATCRSHGQFKLGPYRFRPDLALFENRL